MNADDPAVLHGSLSVRKFYVVGDYGPATTAIEDAPYTDVNSYTNVPFVRF